MADQNATNFTYSPLPLRVISSMDAASPTIALEVSTNGVVKTGGAAWGTTAATTPVQTIASAGAAITRLIPMSYNGTTLYVAAFTSSVW